MVTTKTAARARKAPKQCRSKLSGLVRAFLEVRAPADTIILPDPRVQVHLAVVRNDLGALHTALDQWKLWRETDPTKERPMDILNSAIKHHCSAEAAKIIVSELGITHLTHIAMAWRSIHYRNMECMLYYAGISKTLRAYVTKTVLENLDKNLSGKDGNEMDKAFLALACQRLCISFDPEM